jgi:hypothetical protein
MPRVKSTEVMIPSEMWKKWMKNQRKWWINKQFIHVFQIVKISLYLCLVYHHFFVGTQKGRDQNDDSHGNSHDVRFQNATKNGTISRRSPQAWKHGLF